MAVVALEFANGHDKIRANAVRALGNAASTRQLVDGCPELVQQLVDTIIHNGGNSTLKVQWNACYAVGKVIHICGDGLQQYSWSKQALEMLVDSVSGGVNFKVKIAAAHALAQLPSRGSIGAFLQPIWHALLSTLEGLDAMATVDEYQYLQNLQAQLRCTLVQVILCTETTDLFELGDFLVQKASVIQHLLVPVDSGEQAPAASTSPTGKHAACHEEDMAVAVSDTRKEHGAMCKLLSLYQHQILYAAVARIQHEEERLDPGTVAPCLFETYCSLAQICEPSTSETQIVGVATLQAYQTAVQKRGIQ
eukprot:TRINITY_DN19359_c0_g2_i1.p1 TRINITY_DN19359_c0_g2~~TRINITY_DN19359_c0_g2_i1.p1  ORF type:complete len:307 (-),score=74.48 TRINITY_DN19359_c0_g2_i1:178-1098(-)